MTSRLKTSRYRHFSQFFESIGLGLENFGLEKKSRYRSRKYLVSKKSLSIGLENIWSRKSITLKVLAALISFSKEICTRNTLKRFFLVKCFNCSLKKIWSQDWSWYNGRKALKTLTHSTPLVQSRGFNKPWNLGQISACLCLAKGQKT